MRLFFKLNKLIFLFMTAFGFGGYFLGIPEMVIGIALGYFTGCVCSEILYHRAICKYYKNPGPSSFYEGEAGLAAFCALGIYILSKSTPKMLNDQTAAARVVGTAIAVFPGGKKISATAELFCRKAFEQLKVMNPDLLCESLFARRAEAGDRTIMGSELSSMAMGREAEKEALYIRQFLDPNYQPVFYENLEEDPWTTLGISYGASYNEVKSRFRKLALMYHPDNQAHLDEEERKEAGETFIKIRDAYRVITREIIS